MQLIVSRSTPVRLSVFDARGRLIRAWAADMLEPGDHFYDWDGQDSHGRSAPSGLYLVQVRSEGQAVTRPLVLTR